MTEDEAIQAIIERARNAPPPTEREAARRARFRAHMEMRESTDDRERILANARKHTREDYVQSWRERDRIALKDGDLTEDEKDELQRFSIEWDGLDCPYSQPPEVTVTLAGEGIPHLDAFVQDYLWDILWWANHLGMDLDTYLDRCDLWGPKTRAAVKASPPLPAGYTPTTRR